MPLSAGQTFAGYRIIRLLGSGAMGEVYLAQHPRLPRRDALKVLSAEVSADPDYRARFAREADLASTLWHPNIVGVHDRGEDDGQLWLSMDYVDGIDAARLLASKSASGLDPQQVVSIVTAVASALDYAHDRGLLHRDVKPANIMITSDEQRILLADFGIARSRNDISGLTATNFTVGTVAYAAPEQLMGEELDGRADQYALAATAYQLLTGSQLFPHSNPAVVIGRHLNATPPALAETRPELAALDAVLAKSLAKSPADRFGRCTDFAHALALARIQTRIGDIDKAATLLAVDIKKATTPATPTFSAKKSSATPKPSVPTTGRGIGRSATIALVVGVIAIFAAGLAVVIAVTHRRESSGTPQIPAGQPLPSSSQSVPTSTSSLEPSSVIAAPSTDYAELLINASDINAPVTFKGSPLIYNPDGQLGVATTFQDEDRSHLIKDTIQVFPDTTAATKALRAAKITQGNTLKDPVSSSADVGTGGTTISGDSINGTVGVTVLLFTQGRALVTLKFIGPPRSLAPVDFVIDVGQKQDAAVKSGLGG